MSLKTFITRGLKYAITGQPVVKTSASISYLKPGELLKGKKIMITGGGRGLGFAMAKKFVEEGAKVIISGRNEDTLRESAQKINCQYIVLDITHIEEFKKAISISIEKLGGLNALVNNAGISLHEGAFLNVSPEQFDMQFNCNIKGGYFLTQEFIKQTDSKEKRNVLFISSERGFQADDLPYGLTKNAINCLIKGLAYRFIKEGIRVNGVAPGVTSSDMTKVAQDGNLYYPYNTNDRAYLPEEVAEVATFLISDISSCMSGEIIQCNEAKTVNAHWK